MSSIFFTLVNNELFDVKWVAIWYIFLSAITISDISSPARMIQHVRSSSFIR